ncbi:MAG: hypothetical protein MZV63_52710 [Marinilabiliales bacterium]|nr:hypothetical protein [Marinilabiliales bacterium]
MNGKIPAVILMITISSCAAGCDISCDRSCNITKTCSGYQATWKISESTQRHSVDGTAFITTETTLNLTITSLQGTGQAGSVNLYGCSDLSTEEQGDVMASGKPEGGKYRFWVEPDNLLDG